MKQLLLNLIEEQAQSLATFSPGRNLELLHVLTQVEARTAPEHFIYLWGETAAGKTHLLRALAAHDKALYISGATKRLPSYAPQYDVYLVDDCEKLGPDAQIDAFALFNEIRAHGAYMVTSGAMAPATLPVREDLRTRMGWGLIYQVHALSDAEKIAALEAAAKSRSLNLAQGVLPYLITHVQRDMRSLSTILQALDTYSLETKRPITLPLLRKLLQQEIKNEAKNESKSDSKNASTR
ncbi:MAG: DnaA regulatory inactivator Hda [Burkholderiales bacterium]|nr:DnaA regulatory inactivator Hda [Burkholderiales bacterium]